MSSYKDLSSRKFGKLEVLKQISKDKRGKSIWLCRCECGNLTKVRGDSLTTENSKTCGYCSKNHYEISGNIALGYTSNGKVFIFDSADLNIVKGYNWHISSQGYVATNLNNYGEILLLHNLLMEDVDGKICDHISRNKLDNRRINLRYASPQENTFNREKNSNNTSGFKGVYFDKNRGKYAAEITCNRKRIHLGRFSNAEEAAKAYDIKAFELFGEYAFLNEVYIKGGIM